ATKAVADAESTVRTADAAVVEAQKKLDASGAATIAEARSNLEKAQAAATLARVRAVAARAEKGSTDARLAAEDARSSTPPSPDADGLAVSAARTERDATVLRAEADTLAAEHALSSTKDKKDEGEKKLGEARKKLAEAKEKAKQPGKDYSPLTSVNPKTSTGRRLALAKWITSRQNPLAARVA